jgi:hypothetical protein
MTQPDVYRMIRRRAAAAGIDTKIGCLFCKPESFWLWELDGFSD